MKATRTKKGLTLRLTMAEATDLMDTLMFDLTWCNIKEPQRYRLVVALWQELFYHRYPEA